MEMLQCYDFEEGSKSENSKLILNTLQADVSFPKVERNCEIRDNTNIAENVINFKSIIKTEDDSSFSSESNTKELQEYLIKTENSEDFKLFFVKKSNSETISADVTDICNTSAPSPRYKDDVESEIINQEQINLMLDKSFEETGHASTLLNASSFKKELAEDQLPKDLTPVKSNEVMETFGTHFLLFDEGEASNESSQKSDQDDVEGTQHLSTELRTLTCKECNKNFSNKRKLDAHIVAYHSKNNNMMKLVTSKTFSCYMCNYKTIRSDQYKNHIQVHTGQQPFACEKCEKKFCKKWDLDAHILTKHSKNEKLMSSVTTRVYDCKECGYKTIQKSQLAAHIVARHSKNDKLGESDAGSFKIYQCSICDYKTIRKNCLNIHMQIHARQRSFYCSECGKGFYKKWDLDGHILTKHPDSTNAMNMVTTKIFNCEVCGYKTIHKRHLDAHVVARHPKDESIMKNVTSQVYQCNKCPYKAAHKSSYNYHMRSHSGQQPFLCAVCEKAFSRKAYLDTHIVAKHSKNENLMKTVTRKVFSCNVCDYKSLQKTYLQNHIQKHSKKQSRLCKKHAIETT